MNNAIAGLSPVGYSAQTFELAHALMTDENAREIVRHLLAQTEKPVVYANQDFDRKQYIAAELANIIRRAHASHVR